VEEVPIKSFADDVHRKLSIRKMMQPGRKQVQAEAIEADLEELGAPGSGMGGADLSSSAPGSTTLPGGDDEAAIEAEGDGECPDQYKDADGNCPGDDGFDYDTMGQYEDGGFGFEKEVAPPGYEDMVLKLKKDKSVDNPFAIAWAAYNRDQGKKESARPVRATLLEANAMSPQLFRQYCQRFVR